MDRELEQRRFFWDVRYLLKFRKVLIRLLLFIIIIIIIIIININIFILLWESYWENGKLVELFFKPMNHCLFS